MFNKPVSFYLSLHQFDKDGAEDQIQSPRYEFKSESDFDLDLTVSTVLQDAGAIASKLANRHAIGSESYQSLTQIGDIIITMVKDAVESHVKACGRPAERIWLPRSVARLLKFARYGEPLPEKLFGTRVVYNADKFQVE